MAALSRTKRLTIVSAVAELPGSAKEPSPETQPKREHRPPCFGGFRALRRAARGSWKDAAVMAAVVSDDGSRR
jgi:hypothetical protein